MQLWHRVRDRVGYYAESADPGPRGVVAIGCAALLAALVAGWWLLHGQPQSHAVAAPLVVASSATTSAPSGPSGQASSVAGSSAAGIIVDVAGKVAHPGLYHLRAGSRVDDALRAAGGPVAGVDLSQLNLARQLTDGEQVAVGVPQAADAPGAASTGNAAGGGPVDLNTATADQLDALPGVGPVLAQHILDWRAANGSFTSVDDLRKVSGIGPSKFADIKPLVTVS